MRKLIYYVFVLSTLTLNAQTYNNPGGTINTCSGTFFDSNGGGQYNPSDNITTTICSDDGSAITVAFTFFDLDFANQGHLRVYDGPTTGDPLLDDLTGNNGGTLPSYTATGTCLTFVFQANFFNGNGWAATISCPVVVPTCTEGDCASCGELGFETITPTDDNVCMDGWELQKGLNNVIGPYTVESPATSWTNCRTSTLPGDIYHSTECSSNINIFDGGAFHHDIIDASSIITTDIHQNVPVVPNLSGSNTNVMRLGESGSKGALNQADGMITTFTITDPFLAYHYLLKFESTTHDNDNRGFCTFEIRDNGGTVLPCGSFQVYENGVTNAGENWIQDGTYNSGLFSNGIWYMDAWNTRIVDVSTLIGQEVTIEVWVADCTHGGHAAWGYFDFECLSGVTPDCSVTPLPVEFYGLAAECNDNQGYLTWSTASERDNSHFTVWESTNGIDFNSIGDVLGMGTTTSNHNYSFEIDNNTNETMYYRVSQTDINGTETIHETVAFDGCIDIYADVYVNGNVVSVSGHEIYQITVLDAASRLVKESLSIESKQRISIEDLDAGIYFVAVYQKGMNPQMVRIFKR